jgi:hypothetical protein
MLWLLICRHLLQILGVPALRQLCVCVYEDSMIFPWAELQVDSESRNHVLGSTLLT